MGPDGAVYVCPNGGPGGPGRIERADLERREVTIRCTERDGRSLWVPANARVLSRFAGVRPHHRPVLEADGGAIRV